MKMAYIRITILAYFLTDTLNWQVLWGMNKYLLHSLYEKWKNQVNSKESVSSKDKQINYKSNI